MIFVTTGTQLAFPRLIDAMEALAGPLNERIVAQVGPDRRSGRRLECYSSLAPDAFETFFRDARVVVAHAGIGSILSARLFQKPIIIMPRRYELGEHRNDHQEATAQQVENHRGIYVARDRAALHGYLTCPDLQTPAAQAGGEKERLIGYLKAYIQSAA
ncbi:MAG: glycosyltransferase family 28 protein [Paracoccaceae bacterium]